jgi:hypothetical protein
LAFINEHQTKTNAVAFVKAFQSIREQAHEQNILNHPENSTQTEEFVAIFTKNNKLLDFIVNEPRVKRERAKRREKEETLTGGLRC